MKFGIITLVSDNYGNKYQDYAVEQLLFRYGEVETYGLEDLYRAPKSAEKPWYEKLSLAYMREVLISRMMYRYDINRIDKGMLHNLLYVSRNRHSLQQVRQERSKRFKHFSDEYLHLSDTKLTRENTGKKWAEQFDFFICGSDQIWNPYYATTSELAFCSFAPEKTICLAPSFGVSDIPEYRKQEYGRWLNRIRTLSVREGAGKKIIKDLTGRDAELLLDPTMLLPAEKWEAMCRKPQQRLPDHYMVCYFLGRVDRNLALKIRRLSREKGLRVVMLFDITTPGYYTFDPAEVLYTIRHADYVLTDSFHGTVFSVMFHRNFNVIRRIEGNWSMESRIENLLGMFQLETRYDFLQQTDIPKDKWQAIDQVLDKERTHAFQYLDEALTCINSEFPISYRIPVVYAGHLKKREKLLRSASCGAATALSEAVIKKGGYVLGASYSEDFRSAEYICCEDIEDVEKLKGSKYITTRKNYADIGEKIKTGKSVLFFGLGCDVAALIAYCKKHGIDRSNLYTVDLLCHGPMQYLVHEKFVQDLEQRFHSRIVKFNSRSKRHGWSSSSILCVRFENGKGYEKLFDYTDYGYVFTHYAMKRCMNCRYKGEKHQGDLCIGDYWGLQADSDEYNHDGVSILIIQNDRGSELVSMLDQEFIYQQTDAEFALNHNPMYYESRNKSGDYDKLMNHLREDKSLHQVLKNLPEYRRWRQQTIILQIKQKVYGFVNRLH